MARGQPPNSRSTGTYLSSLSGDAAERITAMKWARYLGAAFGSSGALSALRYYRDITWISKDVQEQMVDYIRGLTIEELELEQVEPDLHGSLQRLEGSEFERHAKSLQFIAAISGRSIEHGLASLQLSESIGGGAGGPMPGGMFGAGAGDRVDGLGAELGMGATGQFGDADVAPGSRAEDLASQRDADRQRRDERSTDAGRRREGARESTQDRHPDPEESEEYLAGYRAGRREAGGEESPEEPSVDAADITPSSVDDGPDVDSPEVTPGTSRSVEADEDAPSTEQASPNRGTASPDGSGDTATEEATADADPTAEADPSPDPIGDEVATFDEEDFEPEPEPSPTADPPTSDTVGAATTASTDGVAESEETDEAEVAPDVEPEPAPATDDDVGAAPEPAVEADEPPDDLEVSDDVAASDAESSVADEPDEAVSEPEVEEPAVDEPAVDARDTPPDEERCIALTRDGKRCARSAGEDSDYCHQHAPDDD
jgi:hypothetical protein